MTKTLRTFLAATAAAFALAAFSAAPASADNAWQAHHPRREQINTRLARQNRRIHREVREGEMSRAQAARLHHADRRIRLTERRMATRNGGDVTKAQQRRLNRRENHVSRRIGK